MGSNKTEHKISNLAAAILIFIAVFIDVLTFLPGVGSFFGPAFWVFVNFYFWYIGLGIVNTKRLASGIISSLIEFIPIIQWLPSVTVGIIIVIIVTRIEEKTGISVISLTKRTPGTTPPRLKSPKLNSQQGIRYPNKN
jgi:hypothetical protein